MASYDVSDDNSDQLDSSSFFCFTDSVDKSMACDLRAFQGITSSNINSPSPILGESSQLIESSCSWAETSVSHGSRRRKTKGVVLNTKKMEKLVNISEGRISPYSSPEGNAGYTGDRDQTANKKDIVRGLQKIKQKGKQRLSQLGSNNKSPSIHNEEKSAINLLMIIKIQRQFRNKMIKLFNDTIIGKIIRINSYRRVYTNDYSKDNIAIKYISLKYIRGCIKTIELWWKRLVLRRKVRYTQYNKWSSRQSTLLFACILGWRVRFLMKNKKILNIKKAIKDIQYILLDIIRSSGKSADNKSASLSPNFGSNEFTIDLVRASIKSGNERSAYSYVSYTDWTLVKTLLKQLNGKNKEFRNLIFHGAKGRVWPAPGYYSLYQSVRSEAIKVGIKYRTLIDSDRNYKLPPPPPMLKPSQQAAAGVPPIPAVLMEVKQIDSSNTPSTKPLNESSKEVGKELSTLRKHMSSMVGGPKVDDYHNNEVNNASTSVITPSPLSRLAESVSPSIIHDKIRPRSLHEVLSSRNMSINVSNDDINADVQSEKVAETHETCQIINGSELEDSSMNDNFIDPVSEAPVSVMKRDNNCKPHIQLDILAADKLMPASKGPISRDINGSRIPDRKPCIRITLYFPNNIEKRPAYKTGRDFTITTLNPRWNSTFYLPLSCPRQIVQAALDECVETGIDITSHSDALLSKVNKALVEWWSSGFISIQVIDGERFNEDIFLGEVTLLLSAFLVPPGSNKTHAPLISVDNQKCKSIHGTFPLSKLHAHDRVSGSIKLASYLHLANDQYIKEVISKTVTSSLLPATVIAEPSTSTGRSPEGKKVSSYNRRQTMDELSKNLDILGKGIQETTNALVDRMNMKLAARLEEKMSQKNVIPVENAVNTPVAHDPEVQYFSAKKTHPLIPKITKIISLEDSDSVIVDEDSNESGITDDYLEIMSEYENDENLGFSREKDSTKLKKVVVNLDLTSS